MPADEVPEGCPLTARQLRLLALVAQGHPGSVIARRLGIARGSVAVGIVAIRRKLGVASRDDAILLALNRGWVSRETPGRHGR